MKQPILFATPLWRFSNPLPKGTYDWALKYQKENPESVVISNRGGYQSKQQGIDKFPYALYLRGILSQFEPFDYFSIDGWWLNINKKGDYNLPHTHGDADLAAIWYITDNEGLLYFQDPLLTSRITLYSRILSNWDDKPNKSINCRAGDLLVFPSDVPHRVEEHQLDTPRISVGINLVANR